MLFIRSKLQFIGEKLSTLTYSVYFLGLFRLYQGRNCSYRFSVVYKLSFILELCFLVKTVLSFIRFQKLFNKPEEEDFRTTFNGATLAENVKVISSQINQYNLENLKVKCNTCAICIEEFHI